MAAVAAVAAAAATALLLCCSCVGNDDWNQSLRGWCVKRDKMRVKVVDEGECMFAIVRKHHY